MKLSSLHLKGKSASRKSDSNAPGGYGAHFKGTNLVRLTALAAAGLVVLNPASTLALGLGAIDLHSALNQPLQADIELLSVPADEVPEVRVRLADPASFERAGMERPYLLSKLKFQTTVRADGSTYITVTSREAIREPFLDFLIEVDWPSGRMLREYALLLDPPVSAPASAPDVQRPTLAAGVATGSSTPSASISWGNSSTASSANFAPPAPLGGQGVYAEDSYGPTTPKDTLWSVAKTMRPDRSISLSQMMLALLQTNPEAFNENNINTLKKGQILRMPDADLLTAMGRSEAEREFQRQMSHWQDRRLATARNAGPVPVAGRPASISPPAVSDSATGRLTLVAGDTARQETGAERRAEVDAAVSGEAASDGAVVTESATVAGLTEQLAAVTEEADSAQVQNDVLLDRLTSLEGQIASLRRLILLKDQAMADLQARLARDGIDESPVPAVDGSVVAELDAAVSSLDSAEQMATFYRGLVEAEDAELGPIERADLLGDSAAGEPIEEDTQVFADPLIASVDATSVAETSLADAADAVYAADAGSIGEGLIDGVANEESVNEATVAEVADTGSSVMASVAAPVDALPEAFDFEAEPVTQPTAELPLVAVADVEPQPQAQSDSLVLTSESVYEVPPATESAGMLATLKGIFSGSLVDNTYTRSILGGVAALCLIVGTFLIRRRRKGSADEVHEEVHAIEDSPAAQSLDDATDYAAVAAVSPLSEEVDPLTEADVYMAYGRYDQAAEMVEKGLAKDADDPGLILKKLEILYAMEDAAGFQSYAQQVHGLLSSADSAGWQEVVSMGQRLCPQDDLFGAPAGDQQSGTLRLDPAAVQQAVAAHESGPAEDIASDLDELQAAVPDIDLTGESEPAETQEDYTLEFDLGFPDEGEANAEAAELPGQESESSKDDLDLGFDFDFDLEGDGTEKAAEVGGTETTAEADDMSLDFELEQKPLAKTVSEGDTNTLRLAPGSESEETQLDGVEALDFEFETDGSSLGDLGETAAEADSQSGEAEPESGFSINLEEEIDTKFELARAYMDLGDGEGAREILTEILAEGAEGQREEARTLMEKIS